jgi:8-oxo-dGTP diphosphatase
MRALRHQSASPMPSQQFKRREGECRWLPTVASVGGPSRLCDASAMQTPNRPIVRIAAAVIRDDGGYFLLVRKRGTAAFMQAGGKIEPGEEPLAALQRELDEELGLTVAATDVTYLGRFEADAANEPGHLVLAELFDVRATTPTAAAAEIAEVAWVHPSDGDLPLLAPLTREHVLKLRRLPS